jgi:opacity protein-like surface antigen
MDRHKIAALLLTFSLVSVPLSTLAEGLYAGVQYSLLKYEQNEFDDADPAAWVIRGGLGVNDNFAFEARLGFGANNDKVGITDVDVDLLAGLYTKANIMTDAVVSPYLIGGLTYLNLNEADYDISYGAGVDIRADKNISINIEYMDVTDNFDNVADVTAVQLGITYKF